MKPLTLALLPLCLLCFLNLYSQPCRIEGRVFTAVETPPQFNGSIEEYFTNRWREQLPRLKGFANVELLIDSNGKACYLHLNAGIIGLPVDDLTSSITEMPLWTPAKQNGFLVSFTKIIKITVVDGVVHIVDVSLKPPLATDQPNKNTANHPDVVRAKDKSVWMRWNFANSMMPADNARGLAIDNSNILWYCTDHGIVRINGNEWQVFNAANTPALATKDKNTQTTGITVDNANNIWVISSGHAVCYDGKTWTTFDTTNSPLRFISHIDVDRSGAISFCGFNGLIRKTDAGWTTFTTANSPIASNTVRQTYLDKDGTLWIATDKGIDKLHDGKWELLNSHNSKLRSDEVSCIKGDSAGNIWAGLGFHQGETCLAKIGPDGKIQCFTTGAINNIDCGSLSGDIWLATINALVKFDGQHFTSFDARNSILNPPFVSDIQTDLNGHKWIATFGGLVYTNEQ